MSAITLHGTIEAGQIVLDDPALLPIRGRVTILAEDAEPKRPNMAVIESLIGTLNWPMSGMEFQNEVRAEWDEREKREFQSYDPSR